MAKANTGKTHRRDKRGTPSSRKVQGNQTMRVSNIRNKLKRGLTRRGVHNVRKAMREKREHAMRIRRTLLATILKLKGELALEHVVADPVLHKQITDTIARLKTKVRELDAMIAVYDSSNSDENNNENNNKNSSDNNNNNKNALSEAFAASVRL